MQKKLIGAACASFVVLALSACTTSQMQAVPDREAAPALDGSLILDAPPAGNSLGQKADELSYQLGLKMRNTPRGKRAAEDVSMKKFKRLLARYSGIAGVELTPENTPETYRLLEMTWPSILKTLKPAKAKFARSRPVVTHKDDLTCLPEKYDSLGPYSYPSGHATRAWTVALTLTALIPDAGEKILREGFDVGESRWICGPHWKSDVEAGRTLGSAVYARLTGDPAFIEQMERAKAELAAKRK